MILLKDEEKLLLGGSNIICWDLKKKKKLFELANPHQGYTSALLETEKGNFISGGFEGRVNLWDLEKR